MEKAQLENFRTWFDEYVAGFYGSDEFVNANIKLKEVHTAKTCIEMRYLADALGLDENRTMIAEAIALFHDLGRFPQFRDHRTYNDSRSVNHCLLSLEVLVESRLLESLTQTERGIIEKAVELHGTKQLPAELNGDCMLFAKLIRDADKLDIYRVIIENYQSYLDDPEAFHLEVEYPDTDQYSPQMIDDIMNERRIDYCKLRTINDMKLLQLGWVYDINFNATLKRVKEKHYLEKLLSFLPQNPDIEKAGQKILQYIKNRIS